MNLEQRNQNLSKKRKHLNQLQRFSQKHKTFSINTETLLLLLLQMIMQDRITHNLTKKVSVALKNRNNKLGFLRDFVVVEYTVVPRFCEQPREYRFAFTESKIVNKSFYKIHLLPKI